MAFTAEILSWRFCHLNIVGAQKKAYQGGVTGTPGPPPPLATPLRKRTTTSTRFDLKFFRSFSKYRLPGKLHFTIFH